LPPRDFNRAHHIQVFLERHIPTALKGLSSTIKWWGTDKS
jgi:hypothetical protein